jgi:F-type H+-transporting ATPase subunit a
MQLLRIILILAGLAFAPTLLAAATGEVVAGEPGDAHHDDHHGLTAYAPQIKLGPLTVTNSMIMTWIVAIALIVFAQFATRKIQAVPSGAQNFWEFLVEGLYNFLEGIVGNHLVKKTFWFFATIFIFILFTNWAGLFPGVGSIGWGEHAHGSFLGLDSFSHVTRPLFRGANADLNLTSAMAIVFCVLWLIWSVQANGPIGFLKHIFGYSGDASGFLRIGLIGVFLAVGVLELISIAFRPVSLSFRLYGNVFAGENLLESMTLMGGPWFGWLIPLPFYFLELIVGLVQALVFMLLTAIFTGLMCQHGDEHSHEPGEKAAH